MPDTLIDYGAHTADMQTYMEEGQARAKALGNRGLITFTDDGALAPDILEAYWRTGFYVFENVMREEDIADIKADVEAIRSRYPVRKGAFWDAQGRTAIGAECATPNLYWSKPLGDPAGGTSFAKGRHPVKMFEPEAATEVPDEIVYMILGSLQFSEACLRLYGHPQLLAVAAAINGEDFAPFNEALFIKEPGLGASVAWHQDGTTHWDAPDWDQGSHGFNFMGQPYGCTAANGLWVVIGSHKLGKADIKAMIADAGSERLPGAAPIICKPGDVAISNRQTVHGSFANTSKDWRVTANMGFHRRRSVLDVEAGGLHNAAAVYDAARIERRARILGYAIAARRERFPDEQPYSYKPHLDAGLSYSWDEAARADLKDYNLDDLSI